MQGGSIWGGSEQFKNYGISALSAAGKLLPLNENHLVREPVGLMSYAISPALWYQGSRFKNRTL